MAEALELDKPLPVNSNGHLSTSWWGLWTLVLTEASLFGYLLLSYFYLLVQTPQHWPPEGLPTLLMPSVNTVVLLSSSVFVAIAERFIKRGQVSKCYLPMAVAILLGMVFVYIQWLEWAKKPYGIATNLYGSLYFTITGFHMAHVVVGLIVLLILTLWTRLGYFGARRYNAVTLGALYWHFVDAVWLVIFSTFYLFPFLPGGGQ